MKLEGVVVTNHLEEVHSELKNHEDQINACFNNHSKVEGKIEQLDARGRQSYSDFINFKDILHGEIEEFQKEFYESLGKYADKIEEQKEEQMKQAARFK